MRKEPGACGMKTQPAGTIRRQVRSFNGPVHYLQFRRSVFGAGRDGFTPLWSVRVYRPLLRRPRANRVLICIATHNLRESSTFRN